MKKIKVYTFTNVVRLHEGTFSDWGIHPTGETDPAKSPRARALYDALGVEPNDFEYQISEHRDGRWALFGFTQPGHRYAVEVEAPHKGAMKE